MKPLIVKFILVACLTALFPFYIHSQSASITEADLLENTKRIGLKIGYNQSYLEDAQIGKLHYSQSGLVYNFHFSKEKQKTIFQFNADFHGLDLESDVADLFAFSGNYVGNFKLDYLLQINASEKLRLLLGPQLRIHGNYFNWLNQDSFTFLFAHSVGLSSMLDYRLSNNSFIRSSLSLPLASLIVRPPWAGYDYELEQNADRPLALITNGYFATISKYLAIDYDLSLVLGFGNSFELNIGYRFQYQYLNVPKHLHFLQHQLTAGFNKKF